MQGFITGPMRLKIGHQWYQEQVYVAPIEQEMLLGFDILRNRGQAILDMGRGLLLFDGMEITMDITSADGTHSVSRVTVEKRRAKVACKMSEALPDYVIEPINKSKIW